jgi:citrate lyase subunit beta / citryl-CoA lyase
MERSILFVPGDSERKFERACTGQADGLVLDLEDSVANEKKPEARAIVRGMLQRGAAGKPLWVRVNALDTGLMQEDLAAVVPARPFGIMLPKCRGRADLAQVSRYLDEFEGAGAIRILVIATETGEAMFGLGQYGGVTPRLYALSWGAEDLAADVGALSNRVDGRYTEPFRLARSMCLFAAAAAGVPAIDTVFVEIENLDWLRAEAQEARRDGFAGKLAIHPSHIAAINEAFSATDSELEWARKVIAAFDANPQSGAFRLDGKMIDRPHLRLARRLLGLE